MLMTNAVVTSEMFKGATTFNQDIGDWALSKNKWFWGMFYNGIVTNNIWS